MSDPTPLAARCESWLDDLSLTHPDRHVGGPGNHAANNLFAAHAEQMGWQVERLPFRAQEWVPGPSRLEVAATVMELHTGPFSVGCDVTAPLVTVSDIEQLEALDSPGAVLLLHGEIASEQITPRTYPFYSMPGHARILAALDAAKPSVVLAATDRTSMAAAVYPFPLFEDADLGHPFAYFADTELAAVLAHAGLLVRVVIDSSQRTVDAQQVVATLPGDAPASGRIVVSAHIDSRYGTPGALDNATGVTVLMALAELLPQVPPGERPTVELVPFNGEDDYAAPGEMAYLANRDIKELALVINLDAAGRAGDATHLSFYGADAGLREEVLGLAAGFSAIEEGPEWPMSDHMVFAMRGVPAIAVTSAGLFEISATVAHTPRDLPRLADPAVLASIAEFLRDTVCLPGLRTSAAG